MKIITAMVQPHMLNKVVYALEDLKDFPGMTVVQARGFGRKEGAAEQIAPHYDPFRQKVRIEIVAPDDQAERIVDTLVEHARTGNDGDGKVFVWDVEHAVRVQTGEQDEAALR